MNDVKDVKSVEDDAKVVKTDAGEINGQDKCPKCGSTDISLNKNNGDRKSIRFRKGY